MAAPSVAATSAVTADDLVSTSLALAMPASIAAGDLLLAIGGTYYGGSSGPTASGWTQLARDGSPNPTSTTTSLFVFAKIAAGSDTCTMVTSSAHYQVWGVMRITGHGVSVLSTDIVLALADSVNPPAGVSSTNDWLIVAAVIARAGSSGPPSGYTARHTGSGTYQYIATASQGTTGSTGGDPGAFGSMSSGYSATILVPPSSGGGSSALPPALSVAKTRVPDAAVIRAGRW